jgi:dienelactone hydrolase
MECRERKNSVWMTYRSLLKITFSFVLFTLFINTTLLAQIQNVVRPTGILPYLEYLPEGYESSGELYPAIIFLHGFGEKGNGSDSQIWRVAKNGPPKLIEQGDKMCFNVNGKEECFIVISPQTNADWQIHWIHNLVDYVKDRYRIDPNRLYLTGLSLGGYGTYAGAGGKTDVPNKFAAIAPVSGKALCPHAEYIGSMNIPVWEFHGDLDTAIPVSEAYKAIDCVKSGNPAIEPILTIYEGVYHNSWDRAYRTDHYYHSPNLYEWFLSYQLDGEIPPERISISAGPDESLMSGEDSIVLAGKILSGTDQVTTCWWNQENGPALDPSCEFKQDTLIIRNACTGSFDLSFNATDDNGNTYSDNMVLNVLPENQGFELIVDNNSSNTQSAGIWTRSGAGGDQKYGIDYFHDGNSDKGNKTFTYSIDVPGEGEYQLFMYWFAYSNRASNTKVEIHDGTNVTTIEVNQQINGGKWNSLGVFTISDHVDVVISNEGTNGYVVADAVRIINVSDIIEDPTPAPAPEPVNSLIIDNTNSGFSCSGSWVTSVAGGDLKHEINYVHDGNSQKGLKSAAFSSNELTGDYEVFIKYFPYSNRASNTPVTIHDNAGPTTLYLNQRTRSSEWVSLGSYTFNGSGSVSVSNAGTDGYVVADAIRFEKVPEGSIRKSASAKEVKTELTESVLSGTAYPNPTSGLVKVDLSENSGSAYQLTVLNSNGHVVLNKDYTSSSVIDLNLENLNTGLYILNILESDSGLTRTMKIVKK